MLLAYRGFVTERRAKSDRRFSYPYLIVSETYGHPAGRQSDKVTSRVSKEMAGLGSPYLLY
jgi:hypothetical protein